MPRNKRLHFKDIAALRAIAFIPIYLFCILFLINSSQTGALYEIKNAFSFIAQSSLDFFFFISAFLLTSHGLREYKYLEKFSLRNFYIRRVLRISVVLILALVFAFFLHPWLIEKLNLHVIVTPSIEPYLLLVPNYFSVIVEDRLIYLKIICSLYMFVQFYFVWGIFLKFLKHYLLIVSVIVIIAGIAARVMHFHNDTSYLMDTLSYGVPIGIGAITAIMVRSETAVFQRIKEFSKSLNAFIYIIGCLLFIGGYILTSKSYLVAFIPVLTSLFYGFLIIEQTFGKNSFVQLKSKKILSYLGKITYGMIVYQAIIGTLLMIAVESLDFDLSSFYVVGLVIIAGFIGTVVTADLSYKLIEKPLMRVRREFKKV